MMVEAAYDMVAGPDVHKKTVVVVVLQNARPDSDHASGIFGTTQFGLEELVAFLRQQGVTHDFWLGVPGWEFRKPFGPCL